MINPNRWPIRRIKDIGKLKLGKMLTEKPSTGMKLFPYLKSKNIGWLKLYLSQVEEMYFSKSDLEALSLKKGDLLFSEGGEVGKTSIWNDEIPNCCIQNSVHKLTVNEKSDAKYYLYFSYLLGQIGYYKSIVNLVSIMHLTYEKLRRVPVLSPPLPVQHRIASYLDAETAKIDHALELLQKKRDAYTRLKTSVINRAVTRGLNPNVPLKKSGVKWMGEIPERWSVYRLKDLGYLYSGLTGKSGEDFRSEDLSSTKPYIPFTNVLNHLEIDPSQVSLVLMKENERQNTVRKNDLIFLMSSEDYESIAKSSLVPTEICETYLNSFCRGFRLTSHLVYAKYLNYELSSILYRDHLRLEARGFTRINIKVDRIESMSVAFPSVPEQRAIASYLDDHCGRIDHAISIVDKQIDAYKRLKKSLINEVVTGKRKV